METASSEESVDYRLRGEGRVLLYELLVELGSNELVGWLLIVIVAHQCLYLPLILYYISYYIFYVPYSLAMNQLMTKNFGLA